MDSYPILDADLTFGDFRWVRSDANMVMPFKLPSRVLCTSDDVIHNFNLKSFSLSVDCVPGRLNRSKLYRQVRGLFSGLCRELCGVGHSHMPRGLEVVSIKDCVG